jgi:hypothetical protein
VILFLVALGVLWIAARLPRPPSARCALFAAARCVCAHVQAPLSCHARGRLLVQILQHQEDYQPDHVQEGHQDPSIGSTLSLDVGPTTRRGTTPPM